MIETWRENARKYALSNFEAMNRRIFAEAAAATDDAVWLSSPSGYVLKTAGVIWEWTSGPIKTRGFRPRTFHCSIFC